jgi:TonB family protein
MMTLIASAGALAAALGLPPETRLPVDCERYYETAAMAPAHQRRSSDPGYRKQSYPSQAIRERIQGEVTLAYDIDMQGRVGQRRLISRQSSALLVEAATEDLADWRFAAGPVRLGCQVTLEYRLPE